VPLMARLHELGTERDTAGNRRLFFDDYAKLTLLYLLNPLISWFFSTNERELNVPLLEYLGILDVTEDFNWSQMDWATTVNSVATEKFGHETPLSMAESEEMVDWLKGALEIADVILTEVKPYQITDQDIVELRSWLDLPPNTLLIEGAK